MRVTILGCGGSGGVPLIGPDGWGRCDPANPKNRRRRASILVETGMSGAAATTLLVDTSPDLREQLIAAGRWDIDAVLYTHCHADHVHGIDDLRAVNYHRRAPLDVYGNAETLAELQDRFGYAFSDAPREGGGSFYRPWLVPRTITGPFRVGAIDVAPFTQQHGATTCLGFRFGPVAYSTDAKALDAAAFRALAGVEVWIVDALREEPHGTHSHLAQTLEWIERVKPARAILTHMNHTLDYATLRGRLPPGIEPAYDGMTIDVTGGCDA